MAISEKARQALQEKLEEVLGPQDAWALMEEVSGRGWGELATKIDLGHLATLTKRDIQAMEDRMDIRFKGLEGRMDTRFEALGGQMDARFEGLVGQMDARFEAVEERIVRFEGVLSAQIDGLGHRLDGLGHRLEGFSARSWATCTKNWQPTPAPPSSPASPPS